MTRAFKYNVTSVPVAEVRGIQGWHGPQFSQIRYNLSNLWELGALGAYYAPRAPGISIDFYYTAVVIIENALLLYIIIIIIIIIIKQVFLTRQLNAILKGVCSD